MNKKLQKLLRNPKRFFLDSKKLRPILRSVGLVGPAPQAVSVATAEPATPIGLPGAGRDARNQGSRGRTAGGARFPVPGPDLATGLELIGENWREAGSRKPVAVLWGFPPQEHGVVSRYLHDYRTAYARGPALWTAQTSELDRHRPSSVIAWGMGEPPEVKAYAGERGIPVYRMAEGFIHSAPAGKRETLPLSLVLDREGIYFDASRPSGLERLLNEHDFNAEPRLMGATGALLRVMRGLRVGQYNPASLQSPAHLLGPRLKRRVLVIGQAEEDPSVRYGLAEGWSADRLIELARAENPGADILYQPHSSVAQLFRANPSTMPELQQRCRVLAEKVVLADLFREVDHVYTLTSLSGLEALIHGLPVTVVGAPFYAGWGLTDDRVAIPRRTRRLSLEELFCGAYLLYPRYLTDLEDPVTGCLAAMLRLTADRNQHASRLLSVRTVERLADQIAASERWPVLLSPKHWPSIKEKYGRNLLSLLPVQSILARCTGDYYQRSTAYLLAGKLRTTATFEGFLEQLRGSVSQQHFAALLPDLRRAAEAPESQSHQEPDQPALPIENYGAVLARAKSELKRKNFEEACRLFNLLLLSGHMQGEVIAGIAEIARLRFDFASAAALLSVYNHYDPIWQSGRGHLLEGRARGQADNGPGALEAMALACQLRPQYVEALASAMGIGHVLERTIGALPYADAMLAANEVDHNGSPIARAKALIACERAVEAERLLLDHTPTPAERLKYSLTLSLAYSYQHKQDDAKRLIVNLLSRHPTLPAYHEGLRLAALSQDYEWGQALLAEAAARDFEVDEICERKIRFAARDIRGAFASYRNSSISRLLRAYCAPRAQPAGHSKPPGDSSRVLVVAFGGLGDEIRFASLYREMRKRCGSAQVTFTCEPRLYPLLHRFYTDLEFFPVGRTRNLPRVTDGSFNQLPGSDLHGLFDNAGWALARTASSVILTSDLLGDVVQDYSSFKGTPYLAADPDQVIEWRNRLARWSDKRLVGLSWRSGLTSYKRNEQYLSVEELAPLFEQENVQFVNLQYGECAEELAWLEARFPGRITNFPDLDQYNDLEGVAALMSCLDLIIAPGTTVFQLAGALGCPTLFFSNSAEHLWRRLPGTTTDVWHRSVNHVAGETPGDKAALVRALTAVLRRTFPSLESVT